MRARLWQSDIEAVGMALKAGLIEPEQALRGSCRKFERRFRHMETAIAGEGSSPSELSLDELEARWQRAKAEERRIPIADPVATKER